MTVPASKSEHATSGPVRIGRYALTGTLGKGAMGTVYRAEDPLIGRRVALKVLSLDLAGADKAGFREHFFSEGKSAGGLNHPNIVTVYDIGESDGVPYIAMEFVQGLSLRETLDMGTVMPVRRVVDIGLAVCRGLDFAHSQGVIHRDIKPANIMLSRSGMVKIMDFGIAHSRVNLAPEQTLPRGHVLGSPKYMAPEQIQGGNADVRSDLFSLGVTLYELLVGRNPFEGKNLVEVVDKVLHFDPPTAREQNPDVPRELDLMLLRVMQKDPSRRFESARDMARVLRLLRKDLRAGQEGGRTLRATSTKSSDGGTVVMQTAPVGEQAIGHGGARRWGGRRLAVAVGGVLLAAWLTFSLLKDNLPVDAPPLPSMPTAAGPLQEPIPLDEVDIFAPPILPLPTVDEHPPQIIEPDPAPAQQATVRTIRRDAGAAEKEPSAAEMARLRLSILPWGEVFVDGQPVGYSPPLTQLRLPPGRHRIEIRNLDLTPFVAEVTLKSGAEQLLRHRFGR